MRKHSRRFQEILNKTNRKKLYKPIDAINLLQSISNVKFVETIEAHIVLDLDPKYADQQLRATVALPKGTGKKVKIAVISKEENLSQDLAKYTDIIGSEDLIEDIMNGRLDFDKLIVSPDIMPAVAKLGKILGPRGLMPSPKSGTVTTDLINTVKQFKSGKLEYRVDRSGIVHVPFGKLNFATADLMANLMALHDSIDKNRPSGSKGKYRKSMYLSTTMGPSIAVDFLTMKDNKI